jgi:hypothetical protein
MLFVSIFVMHCHQKKILLTLNITASDFEVNFAVTGYSVSIQKGVFKSPPYLLFRILTSTTFHTGE